MCSCDQQRIATYDTTDLGKLNADQQRAFASKGGIEMSVFELSEALKGVQVSWSIFMMTQ